MRRGLTSLLLVVACAGGTTHAQPSPSASATITASPSPSPTPSATPRGPLLGYGDFPDGWADLQDLGDPLAILSHCTPFPAEPTRVQTSKVFVSNEPEGRREVASQLATMPSTADATGALRVLRKGSCFQDLARQIIDKSSNISSKPPKTVALRLPAPESAVAFQSTGERSYKGYTEFVEVTFVTFARGKQVGLVLLTGYRTPFQPPLRDQLLAAFARRVADLA